MAVTPRLHIRVHWLGSPPRWPVKQFALPRGEPSPQALRCLANNAVLDEVVVIEKLGLADGVGKHPSVESAVGAFGEIQHRLPGVSARLQGGVDVDEVTGESRP
jgi:hypothetical protein